MNLALQNWADMAAPHFEKLGASKESARKFALLYVTAHVKGFQPRITSIFRDPAKQKAMQERWDRGDRSGLRARPATDSQHTKVGFFGGASSKAMDMVTNNENETVKIAREIGLGAGATFAKPDPGHYYAP